MKNINLILHTSFSLLIAVMFFACTSTSDKTSKDEFFEPVNKIVHQKTEEGNTVKPVVITRERYGESSDENMKDAIIEMLRQQNRRLEDVILQLNQLTNKEVADNSLSNENFNRLASRDKITNETLLEMIKEQNQRLNDVVEQLKVLTQNQQTQRGIHSTLVARVNATPIEPPPVRKVQQPTKPVVSLNYAKAIQLYQSKQYDAAIQAFKSLISRGIDAKLVDNCYFWMGVCYFNQRMSNKAISAFSEVLNYADSDKAESAYFMIGQSYEQMGAKRFASMTFEKMIRQYPKGALKQVGEKKLALLK